MSGVCKRLRRIIQSTGGASPLRSRSLDPALPTIAEIMKEPNLDELVRKFMQKCGSRRFRNNQEVYVYTIDRLARAKRFSAIKDILEAQKNYNEIRREGFSAKLIRLYGYAGMFDGAHKLFDELPDLNCSRTVKSFTALLGAAQHCNEFSRVLLIFGEYPQKYGVEPDITAYNIAIGALCQLGMLEDALLMVDEILKKGLTPDNFTFNIIVDAFYSKRGFREGEKVWNLVLAKVGNKLVLDIKSFNLKLFGMVKQGMVSEAVALFEELESKGTSPNLTSFNNLIRGFCNKGDVEGAARWYERLRKRGLEPNAGTFYNLIPVLCKREDYCDLAFDLSKRMFGKHFVVDEALLQIVVDKLVKESRIEQAMDLVEKGKLNFYTQYNLSLSFNEDVQSCKGGQV